MAKVIASTNPAMSLPMTPETATLLELKNDLETRTKGAYNSKAVLTSASPINQRMGIAQANPGGAYYPGTPEELASVGIIAPNPEVSRLSDVSVLQYTYSLRWFENGFLRTGFNVPSDFTAEVYMSIGVWNANYFYNSLVLGSQANDKWVLLNNFLVAKLHFNAAFGAFRLENVNGSENISETVNWFEPIADRSVASSGGGILYRNFSLEDNKKITEREKAQILSGEIGQINVSVAVRTDNIAPNNAGFLSTDVAGTGSFTFTGSFRLEYVGVMSAFNR